MKIGYDAKRFFHNNTGLGNYSRDLIRILSLHYPSNEYLLYNPKPKKNDFKFKKNIKEVLPKTKLYRKLPFLWRQKGIVKQLVFDGVDIFHGLSGELPRGIHRTNIKTIVTIHDLIFLRYPKLYSFIDRKIHYNKFKYAAEVADVVVAISEQTKKDIVKFLNINPSKIVVLYQGCNNVFKETFSDTDIKNVKSKFNLPDKFLLNVGTIEERKNLMSLVKAIRDTDDFLVVVGNDKSEYAKQIKRLIEKYNMGERVLFLKNVSISELAIIYQIAEIFIYPSIFEGFGIPIIEALYSKTPVITSNKGCFPEAGGKHSKYIDPYNINEIKLAIKQLQMDHNMTSIQVDKSFEYTQKFNDQFIAKRMMDLYKRVL